MISLFSHFSLESRTRRSRVEAWQSVPLRTFHLPGFSLFRGFFESTSAEIFVTKSIVAILVSLLFLIGNHNISHNERRRATTAKAGFRLSVRNFWNTQTLERLSLNFKWRETRNNSFSDFLKTDEKERNQQTQTRKKNQVLLECLKLTNRNPAAWRSPSPYSSGKEKSLSLESGKTTTHWLSILFFMLLVSNAVGLVPLFSAITGRAGFTLGLSIALLSAITLRGVKRQGILFPRLFLPSGPRWPMAPLFILLESISFAFRAISLGTRLYCNLFAGHLLLHLFTSLCLVPVVALPLVLGAPITMVVATVLIALSALESIVVVLQSGVFCLLTSFYLTEVLSKKEKLYSKKRNKKKK